MTHNHDEFRFNNIKNLSAIIRKTIEEYINNKDNWECEHGVSYVTIIYGIFEYLDMQLAALKNQNEKNYFTLLKIIKSYYLNTEIVDKRINHIKFVPEDAKMQ